MFYVVFYLGTDKKLEKVPSSGSNPVGKLLF
jgi:hypothetical protein